MPEFAVSAVQPGEWDALLRAFPRATVFHRLCWLETIAASHNVKIMLARADRGGQCAAVWPYLELRKGPLRVIGSPLPGWSTAYLGPVFLPGVDALACLSAFLKHRLFKRYAYIALKVLDRDGFIDLATMGFAKVVDFETYLVDLTQTEETLWGNLKSECRTRIRKGERHGLEIREEADGQFIDDFWAMSLETFSKSKIQPTHTKLFAQELWARLRPQGLVHGLSAFLEGKRIATLVLPYDDHTMYYWGGASFHEYREVPAHNLLHWRAIRDAKAKGLKHYDFISTFGGPGRFKKTFGPEAVHVATHWDRSPSKLMALLKKKYESYLRKRQRVSA